MPAESRREFLRTGTAALTASLFAGKVRGANDRPAIALIGCGRRGSENLNSAAKAGAEIAGVCDIDPLALARAVAQAQGRGFHAVKAYRDHCELLDDPSIDAVALATPDRLHARMTIEACRAGKDVWCETPAALSIDDGVRVVQAARKYGRVMQAATTQRSGSLFRQVRAIVRSARLGEVTFCNLSVGMSCRGIHQLDFVQFVFDEAMPVSVSAQDGGLGAGALRATYRYPGFVCAYESRTATGEITFHGTDATLTVNRDGYRICAAGSRQPIEAHIVQLDRSLAAINVAHWKNFLECLRTRKRPVSDIETCVRSTTAWLLTGLALRHNTTLDWDEQTFTVKQPWKLEV